MKEKSIIVRACADVGIVHGWLRFVLQRSACERRTAVTPRGGETRDVNHYLFPGKYS